MNGVLALLIALFPSQGAAAPSTQASVREARQVRDGVQDMMDGGKTRAVLLFRRKTGKDAGPWERWKSGPLPKRVAAADVHFDSATIRFLREWDSTDTAGWIKLTEYFYRADGRLATIESELTSVQHRMIVKAREYYDPSGFLVERFQTAYDLQSGETQPEPTYLRDQSAAYPRPEDFLAVIGEIDLN